MMIDLPRSRLPTLSARIARKASNHDTNDKATRRFVFRFRLGGMIRYRGSVFLCGGDGCHLRLPEGTCMLIQKFSKAAAQVGLVRQSKGASGDLV